MALGGNSTLDGNKQTGVVYEYIKKADIQAAFRDALTESLSTILAKLDHIIDLYSATAQPSLWTWDNTSRWDYDKWW
jgi:hypothetical protein